MQFLYHERAGDCQLEMSHDDFSHIIKARRAKLDSTLQVRNLRDSMLHTYKVVDIKKKSALLEHISQEEILGAQCSHLHLLWAVIDPKAIEKTLPMLNELGIPHISFFYAEFSQRHFRLNLDRMQKILIASSQQCGRAQLMNLEVLRDFDEVCRHYAPFYAFDFGGKDIAKHNPFLNHADSTPVRIMLGAEGGFSQKERRQFAQIITLHDTLRAPILRSESASVFLASLARLHTTQTTSQRSIE